MDIQKYINGFENGWFSMDHDDGNGDTYCNCSWCGQSFTESTFVYTLSLIENVDNCIIWLSNSVYNQFLSKTEKTRKIVEETLKKNGDKVIKYTEYYITALKALEERYNVKFKKFDEKNSCKWFMVWGDSKKECYGSTGDGKIFK